MRSTLDQFRPIVDWARTQGGAPIPVEQSSHSSNATVDEEQKAYAAMMASIFSLDTLRAPNRAVHLSTAGSKQVLAERLCERSGMLSGERSRLGLNSLGVVRPTDAQLTFMAMIHRKKNKLPPLAAVTVKSVATEWIAENGDPGSVQ